jgi:hypothetical protein
VNSQHAKSVCCKIWFLRELLNSKMPHIDTQRLWRWINNQLDAEDDVFIGVSTCFGHHQCPSSGEWYKTDSAYGVQHWLCCSRLEEKRWLVCTCWDWWNQSQQVHTEPHLLHESTAAQSVLYTIGFVGFVPFSWWWAWWCPKQVETPINTLSSASSWLFIHLHDSRYTVTWN